MEETTITSFLANENMKLQLLSQMLSSIILESKESIETND
jgi:hypothetical protein